MARLIQALPDGPLDIIGDVHGELAALEQLLERLGYGLDPDPEEVDRRLVFVGDLTDRGRDSPSVCRLVKKLCDRGVAQCIVGNHELNILRGAEREGNGWILGHDDKFMAGKVSQAFESEEPCDADEAAAIIAWFQTLPLALTRDDIRVVHACWDQNSVDKLPPTGDVAALCDAADDEIEKALKDTGVARLADMEEAEFGGMKDPNQRPTRTLRNLSEKYEVEQTRNAIRVLTSGTEEAVDVDGYAYLSGKWRTTRRTPWWDSYEEEPAVIAGHYWRSRHAATPGGRDIWQGAGPFEWLGPRRNVFCIDYSVGRRFLERTGSDEQGAFNGALAAMRWPERELVFDDTDDRVATVSG